MTHGKHGSVLYSPLLAHFLFTDVGQSAQHVSTRRAVSASRMLPHSKGSEEEAMKWWLRSLVANHAKLRPFSGSAGFSTKGLQLDGVKNIVAIASGKGGVGKSTTAVNLAVALAKKCQLKVGVLDADVYGPSVPTMMNLHGEPEVTEDRKIVPFQNYGVKCMSIGFLVPKDSPLVWRGPMVASALEKLSRGVDWGNLDILVVDMPPGTGDTQITISQRLQLTGVLIVTTPQDVALIDARRGVTMFSKVEVPILGIIENMSCFKCPNCGHPSYIFGNGGARKTADEMCLDYLGEIPLEVDIVKASDEGVPLVVSAPDSSVTKGYNDLAQKLVDKIGKLANEQLRPEISL